MPLTGEYEPSPVAWSREQAELFESSNGAQANTLRGKPIVLVTMRGAKTGKLRKVPLMRVEHGGTYAIVASSGGDPQHPVWYHNLVANSEVELQDGAVRKDMVAREITGDEKAEWWERCVAAWPDYALYQTRTDREIPVFLIEPISN